MSLTKRRCTGAKEQKKHKQELNRHLREFLTLLGSRPQPDNETVRNEFLRHEAEWRLYCFQHNLGIRTSELFNAQVSYQWETNSARQDQ